MKVLARIVLLIVFSVLVVDSELTVTSVYFQEKSGCFFLDTYRSSAFRARTDGLCNEMLIIQGNMHATCDRAKEGGSTVQYAFPKTPDGPPFPKSQLYHGVHPPL